MAGQDDLPDLGTHCPLKRSALRLNSIGIAAFAQQRLTLHINLPQNVSITGGCV
nr:hypothetical protein [Brevundimonas sp.]